MKIQILGTGCKKCEKLAKSVQEAASELNLNCDIEKVTDLKQIMGFGVMLTPALAVEGEVKLVGKVPSVAALKKLLV